MAPAKRVVKPRSIAAVRRLYEHTNVPVEDLAAMLGVTKRIFYERRKRWGWKLRFDRLPKTEPPREPDEIEPAGEGATRPELTAAIDKAAIARGMYALVQTTMDVVARIMGEAGPDQTDAAQEAARMTASLARTLQEIARFEQRSGLPPGKKDDDRGPADPDEFARMLLRRLDEFKARRAALLPDGAGAGGP